MIALKIYLFYLIEAHEVSLFDQRVDKARGVHGRAIN